MRLHATLIGWVFCATVLQPAGSAQAEEFGRGRALYDFACDAYHDRGVHQRNARKATNFDELRTFVVRWNSALGTQWTDEEINEVSRYLNERYYHFPCTASMCQGNGGLAQ